MSREELKAFVDQAERRLADGAIDVTSAAEAEDEQR